VEGLLNFSLIERQNILIEIDLFKIICKAMSKEKSAEIQENLLILGIKLLEGGNELGQEKLLEYIQSDKENTVFLTFKNMMMFSFDLIQKEMALFNDGDLENIIGETEIDTFMAFNNAGTSSIKKSNVGINEHISNIEIHLKFTILILRFLQLFCEGHNLKMQNLLREQPHVFL
jgi:hypothetical protein